MAKKAKEISKDQQIINIIELKIDSQNFIYEKHHQAVLAAAKNLVNDPDNDRYWADLCCAVSRYDKETDRCRTETRLYQRLLGQLINQGIITKNEEG